MLHAPCSNLLSSHLRLLELTRTYSNFFSFSPSSLEGEDTGATKSRYLYKWCVVCVYMACD